jgi:Mrp family chromosome partitioning ATPase
MIENNPFNEVKKVIAVMSGKGGVGKSTVTALIAKNLRSKGFKVGILDADITGPSIPRLLNVRDKKVENCEFGYLEWSDYLQCC